MVLCLLVLCQLVLFQMVHCQMVFTRWYFARWCLATRVMAGWYFACGILPTQYSIGTLPTWYFASGILPCRILHTNCVCKVPTGKVPPSKVPAGKVPAGKVTPGKVPTGKVPPSFTFGKIHTGTCLTGKIPQAIYKGALSLLSKYLCAKYQHPLSNMVKYQQSVLLVCKVPSGKKIVCIYPPTVRSTITYVSKLFSARGGVVLVTQPVSFDM